MFGALLDQERGGRCTVAPIAEVTSIERRYLDRTMVLETLRLVRWGSMPRRE